MKLIPASVPRRLITTVLALACLLAATAPARAVLAEPDNILWGSVARDGSPVTAADFDVVIEVRRTPDGAALARYEMGSNPRLGDLYSLRVRLESLTPVTSADAFRTNEPLYVVVSDYNGVRELTNIVVSARGSVRRLNLGTVTSLDADNDGLPDSWEQQYFGGTGQGATGDSDRDGVNNVGELRNGTNPNVADTRHPADLNPTNNFLTIHEVTAYGLAWKTGQPWSITPTNIDLNFVTRAGFLWKNGEEYRLDLSASSNAPLWWVPGRQTRAFARAAAVGLTGGTLTRRAPDSFVPGQEVPINLVVAPESGVSCHAIEETVPAGWEVVSISHEGSFDGTNRIVRWGPFFDEEGRELGYVLRPRSGSAAVELAGSVSFDGRAVATVGRSTIVRTGYARLAVGSLAGPGTVPLTLLGEPERDYVIEFSPDLVNWTAGSSCRTDADGSAVVSVTGGGNQRFFRARRQDL